MRMRLYGEYSCPLLFKLQFILGKSFRDFTFHQELNLALIETLVSCNWEADHGSERNYCLLTRQFSSRLQKPDFSDSVLCLGGICQDRVRAWREKVNLFMESRPFREMDRTDREPMFEWKIFHGFTTLEILAEIRVMMTDMKCEPEHCQKKDHLHVNVKRHGKGKTRQSRKLYCEFF